MAHAHLSPSSAEKWMTCAGALAMEDGIPDTPSEYSDEGTAAHFLAAHCLANDAHPAAYIGKTIAIADEAFWLTPDVTGYRSQFRIDMEMAGHVNTYVQNIKRFAVGGMCLVEQRIQISQITGEEDAGGTADAVILQGDELQIHDLKYGMGVQVEAEENKQLMIYALGALEEYSLLGEFNQVRLFIHQPRVHHAPSEWVVSVEALREFGKQVTARAEVCDLAFEHRANWLPGGIAPDTSYLTPSEKGCKWCKAKADCPALAAFVADAVGAEFEELTEENITPEHNEMHVELARRDGTLSQKMAACDLIEQWIKAVRAKVEAELFAGREVPGYKLVKGRKGPRAWSSETEAEETLKSMRLKQEEMYDFKLISPTSAEKIFGEKGSAPSTKRWNKLQALITQSDGKPSVAPASDKRPALVIQPAEEAFDNLDSGEDLA